MQKFQNKYRIPSARAQWWDYSNDGAYFITIKTNQNAPHFWVETRSIASLQDFNENLSPAGEIAKRTWMEIPQQFEFIQLGSFVIMPDHVHGILMIDDSVPESLRDVETRLIASLPESSGGITGNHNPMFHENIARVIRWYKGRASFEIRKTNPAFAWQGRFYDRIIRDQDEYNRIKYYIWHNPQ